MNGVLLLEEHRSASLLTMSTPSQPWTTAEIPSQAAKLVVITGANSGIGFEAAKALVAQLPNARLNVWEDGADVGLRGGLVRPVLEGQVRRHCDREQDAEDDDDHQELDEGETLLRAEAIRDASH